ncbi:hypothetical protein U1Q18_039627 [Sarracenia purpurea var. burkii]
MKCRSENKFRIPKGFHCDSRSYFQGSGFQGVVSFSRSRRWLSGFSDCELWVEDNECHFSGVGFLGSVSSLVKEEDKLLPRA